MNIIRSIGKWIEHKAGPSKSKALSENELIKMLESLWEIGPDRAQFYRRYEGNFGRLEILYQPKEGISFERKRSRKINK